MPTLEHQALVILMTESPRLAPLIRHRAFGLDLPLDVDVLPGPEISRDLRRPDLIVDGTVLVHDGPPSRREGFAMEAQRQPDEEKRMSWPVQVAGLRRRLGPSQQRLLFRLRRRFSACRRLPPSRSGSDQLFA